MKIKGASLLSKPNNKQAIIAYLTIFAAISIAYVLTIRQTQKMEIFFGFFACIATCKVAVSVHAAAIRAAEKAKQQEIAEERARAAQVMLEEQRRAMEITAADQEELARLRATGGIDPGPRLSAAIAAAKMAKDGASRHEIARWLEKMPHNSIWLTATVPLSTARSTMFCASPCINPLHLQAHAREAESDLTFSTCLIVRTDPIVRLFLQYLKVLGGDKAVLCEA